MNNTIKLIFYFRTYDMFLEGEFVMYKHKTLPYQVKKKPFRPLLLLISVIYCTRIY